MPCIICLHSKGQVCKYSLYGAFGTLLLFVVWVYFCGDEDVCMKSPFLKILQSNYDFKGLYRGFFHGPLAHVTFGECSVSVFLVLLDSNFNQQK